MAVVAESNHLDILKTGVVVQDAVLQVITVTHVSIPHVPPVRQPPDAHLLLFHRLLQRP